MTETLGQQVSEEKIVFGLLADCSNNYTLSELLDNYHYSAYDIATIAREVRHTHTCTHFLCSYTKLCFLNKSHT